VTGYIALVLLALTLLVGPASLLRRRPTPLSSYLTRDVGIMAAIVSIAHVIFGFLVDHSDGILGYFFEPGDRSRILTTSFGLANWTGLAAVVTVAALAVISSDRALRALKARRWKRIQRLNYVLFPLVIAHAVLYGALLRITSPYTALLGVSAVAVLAGQLIGIRLWRQRRSTA
jgi:sulfoxide reductase heme-binding subunit YedZ